MVDFRKQVPGKTHGRSLDPVELYGSLDRSVDKGPLRPAQLDVLRQWHEKRRAEPSVLVKLHTGQGKTLVGLLMLQAQLNKGEGPAVYICPDNYLIDQTCEQAKQFGIRTCRAEPDLPDAFVNGERILVTSVQKVFNGLTKFGLGRRSISVGTMLLDDAHACSDSIRDACRIRIPKDEPAYATLRELFSEDLEKQGVGSYADLLNGSRDAVLPVPYWTWQRHISTVAKILSDNADRKSIKFAWPLLKDSLESCQCVFSGNAVELEPYLAPLEVFGSYTDAKHRVFMSATVTDDAFLVKGLKISPEVIKHPITFADETWSGEKMILIPSLVGESLDRAAIVGMFARPNASRRYGVVALVPGFDWSRDWEKYGSRIATKETVTGEIEKLRQGALAETLVLVNRYHGIDLPDDTCRILIFDSKPYSENLVDRYEESCRPSSATTLMRAVRTIEQGMGRSVRGEKDYSAVIVTGPELTRLLRDKHSRAYLSSQMEAQITMGLEIAELAQEEAKAGGTAEESIGGLIRQSLGRDEGWKDFYISRMEEVRPKGPNGDVLETYSVELEAERDFGLGNYASAAVKIQALLDRSSVSTDDRGWYLQTMARYQFQSDRTQSEKLQVSAHKANRYVLKPDAGITVTKLNLVSHGRVERIIAWAQRFDGYGQLEVELSDILVSLRLGVAADRFEHALNELSVALGFKGERPDKEWKEGPDNLWAVDDKNYILWECKSEVELTRLAINKRETEQMNRSVAWFSKHYPSLPARKLIVHPAYKEESAASFLHPVEVVRSKELKDLVSNVAAFFKSFETFEFADMSATRIQGLLTSHRLTVDDMLTRYGKAPKPLVV
jgi:replicative superfamily II helicase